jgi:hypothetical protein
MFDKIKKDAIRDAVKEIKRYARAENKMSEETLLNRADKNFRILDREEATAKGYNPSGEFQNFLVLEKGKVFGWFFSREGAESSIKAKVIKNTIPKLKKCKSNKKKLLTGYNTAKG